MTRLAAWDAAAQAALTRLNMSSFTGWKRYDRGMDSRRPAVMAAQNILAR